MDGFLGKVKEECFGGRREEEEGDGDDEEEEEVVVEFSFLMVEDI